MLNEYIAGIFVAKELRSHGIGRQLLNYVKQRYEKLSLEVYRKNIRAIAFYQREGFSILSEAVDEDTDEKEYIMVWKKEN
ncbi:GNAT family N-acetyltransferase [Blautia sp. Sow4_E7]|uniref:GNAT family N-acetyltransferase n=1 Tax=Blautia sp. Sow4_E7 TaxID=3438749 RepID=UPI003F934E2A